MSARSGQQFHGRSLRRWLLRFVLVLVGLPALLLVGVLVFPPSMGDPFPDSHKVILRNTSDRPLYVGDDANYATRLRTLLRLEPGETTEAEIGYLHFKQYQNREETRKNEFCVGAKLEDDMKSKTVFYRCVKWGELEDSGWHLDIVEGFVERH